MSKEIKRILVTGALGQIGTELTIALVNKYGAENVIISDIKDEAHDSLAGKAEYFKIDVRNFESLEKIILDNSIDTVFHMAAILSATGENNPQFCWEVNMNGTLNILETARKHKLNRVIIPSSIAVWGKGAPRDNTPQETVLKPTSMYGVTKVCGELLCDYYVDKFGVDCRGLRYPGIISSETLPGGGTTDYAVEIFYEAIKEKRYKSFLSENTVLPMMYMPDCIKATLDLAEAPVESLKHHSDFNVAAMSFDPATLALEIKKHIPDFVIEYEPDYRQKIADSWPRSIDDTAAREEWNWKPEYNIETMSADMIEKLSKKLIK